MPRPFKPVSPPVPPTENIQTIFKHLSQAAIDLNSVSDELSKPIQICESALKKLNLGVSAWVDLASGGDGGPWWDRSIGYTKLQDRWGITLRSRSGHEGADELSEELWPFNDSPRWMRLEAITKLPDLLKALIKQAEETTQKMRKKIALANEQAEAITEAVNDSINAEQR
jgi:hypothetical protein